ncbi:amino acid adenylation domain-containing protein [Gordonia sp. (in: high G+C Gram-positive bacteria)]|uniref:amino acid adenylation domain-containing protein n=1 Tax=Gordonia sp. (in: high G+C Gram-positive bacteria) TaxID=84139 RepID=UPI003C788299
MDGVTLSAESDASLELLPLTPAQRGMWFAETLSPDYSVNIAQYLDLRHAPGGLDIDLLVECCEAVGKAIESPYVRLVEVDGVPMQYVDVDYDQHVDVYDFRGHDDPFAAATEWMQADYRRPVDLLNDQLIVVAMLRITDERTLWYTRCHHIMLDGYAALAVSRRVVNRYNAARRGEELVEKAPLSMSGIIAYEEAYQTSSRRETDRAHWLERVGALPERVTLSHVPTTAPVVLDNLVTSSKLDTDLQERIEATARTCNSSMAVLLSAAFAAFLGRMSGTDDVVLSLPVTGRSTAAIKRSGGMVSNILPIRVTEVLDRTVRELIDATQLELTGALRYQRYRSDDIKRDAGLDGSTYGFGPRINMVFFDEPISLDGVDAEYRILTSGMLEDLLVNLYQASPEEPLVLDLHGNPHLYTQAEIDEHHRRFLHFVDAFIGRLDAAVADVALLLPGESAKLIALEAGPRTEPARDGLLDPFLRQVSAHPDRIAVADDDREWTYAEFDRLRRTLAAELAKAGVRRDDKVVIELDRGIEQVVAIYATLTLGAAYVPLDPSAPAGRRSAVVAAAKPALVVTTEYLASVSFDSVPRADAPSVPTERGHSAYIIFTSGSTGVPKGVEVSVSAVANRLAWMQRDYPASAADIVMYKTPFTFDVSVWELFWPLQVGCRMVIAQAGGHRDPAYLRALIDHREITTVHFVPSMLDVFVDAAVPGSPVMPASVRHVFTSGEGLPAPLAQRVTAESDAQLVNLYGPTEAAVEVTAYDVRGDEPVIPIGRPVPNTTTYVLDSRLRRVPVGVAGELYLAGVQLADGYVGQEALTAERFVADPFDTGARAYRTGDLVRWNADGDIEYLGRTDFQVKIRGQRIELGEIEAALLAEGSADSVAVVVRHDTGSPAIVAYIRTTATESTAEALAERLQRWCVRQLPRYMVPAAFVVLESFPVNSAGKLDRSALPAPVYASTDVVEHVPATSETEKTLVRILHDLVEVEQIGMRDNIFALGADSLTAARLASRLRNECGVDVRLTDIFESGDVAELAARVSDAPASGDRLPLRPVPRPDPIPVAYAQTRLWFINRLDPESPAYNMPGAVRLGDQVNLDALRAAVLDLVARHEVLRTRLPAVDGEPTQEILPLADVADDFALPVREVATDDLSAAILGAVSGGFDLISQIPFRVTLLRADAEYVLVVVLHHVAGDGASLRPLIADLLAAYGARSTGQEPAWTPLPVQYADYALWQREMLGEADDPESRLRTELDFWQGELAGMAEILELPADRPRPKSPSGAGAYVDATIPEATAARVRTAAARLGVTTFTILHTALATVLGRLADIDDVAVGTAVAGRDEAATADLVGMFVNTVVLRTALSPAQSAADAVIAAHRTRTRALAHSQVPFEEVVDAVAPHRSRTISPLFQVTLTLQNDIEAAADIRAAGGDLLDARPPVAKVDLAVAVTDRAHTEGGMAVELCYATDLYDEHRIAALAAQFRAVVEGIVTHPDAPIGRIDLVDVERLAALAAPIEPPATPGTLRALIEAGAAKVAPLAPAIVGNGTLTHRLLASRTNQLARELIARGIGAGDAVAVSIPRSHHSVVAMIAVAKTGAAFVMIDPRHPAERRAELIADAGATIGLTSTAVTDPAAGPDWIVVDGEADELQLAGHSGRAVTDDELVRPVRPDNAAYILFTSGSTGKPKGAVVSNRAITNVAVNTVAKYEMDTSSCMLHVGAPSFDGAMGELVPAWLAGARIAVADFDTFAGRDLERFIAKHGATHANFTPAAAATLDPVEIPTFTHVACGGEALPPEMVNRWAALGDRRMYNIYGPTEAAVWVTCDGPFRVGDEVTIGSAGEGVGALVLDRGLRPVPDGVMGELYVYGDQVGLGYLDRLGLTAAHYVANPFGDGIRMYRTGDRVTRLADGRFTYHGRSDFQLKIRGQRIEPGELDGELLGHPDVTNAISLGVPGPSGDTVLASYVTLTAGSTLTSDDLIDYVAGRLPTFLVPRALMIVDEFAWTPIGKIDRKRLPAIDFASSTVFEAPRTQLESVVADIFGQVLGLDRVSVNDDFFDLGGNSLSATKVTARLGAALDCEVPVATLFEAPTVAALGERAVELMGGRPAVPLGPRTRAEVVPVSGVQRGMWLINRADPHSPAYNIALALSLAGELDVAALTAAVGDLIARHESLRTSYPMINAEPSQFISSPEAVLDRIDLTPVDVVGSLDSAIRGVTGIGFDVTLAPPVRLALLRVAPAEHVIVLVIHHISADGASMSPMARDLMMAYTARSNGAEPAWRPLRVQYADFALWQGERLAAVDADGVTVRRRQLDYWRRRLAGAPEVLALPTDRPRPPVPSFVGGVVPFEIPVDLVRSLESVAHRHNTTLFMVTQAAYAILLARLSGSTDVVVGTPYGGRGDAALDDVIGMFVNTLALRTIVDPGERFDALLSRVRADDLADMSNADVAFDEVTAELGVSRTAAVNPVFQAMFWFQNLEFPAVSLGGLDIAPVSEELAAAKVDFQLTLFPNDPADLTHADAPRPMRGEIMYATDLFDPGTIEKHAQRYVSILEQITADPEIVVGDLSISTATDRMVAEVPATASLPELVTAAAAAAPDGTALAHDGAVVTFTGLSTMTTAMAAALPDMDSALVTALMSLAPTLASAGPEALGTALESIRANATSLIGSNFNKMTGQDTGV